MSDILIRPPQLRSTGQSLRQQAKAIRTALENVDQILKELAPMRFEGSRASVLRSRYSHTHDQIFQAPGLIEKFAQELEQAATVFEQADQGGLSLIGIPPITIRPLPVLPLPIKFPDIGKILPAEPSPINIVSPKPSNPLPNIGLNQNNYTDVMGDNGMNIKQVGCLITDVAMIGRFLGKDMTPEDVNSFLRANNGYAPGSSDMYWSKAAEFLNSSTGSHGSFVDIAKGNVASALQTGEPVILHISGATSDGHWVLAVPGGDGSSFVAFDPLTGGQTTISADKVLSAKAFTAGNVSA